VVLLPKNRRRLCRILSAAAR